VKKIEQGPCTGGTACGGSNTKPQEPVQIKHIEITGAGGSASTGKKESKTHVSPTMPKNIASK
jgi:hypothetical protein